jgi:tetratricopeptide (TPR) repeat protein
LPSRRRPSEVQFFDGLREAESRLPAGLLRLGPPAAPAAIAATEERLGRPLPHAYAEFLRSFDGADLFHESLLVFGVGDAAQADLAAGNADRPLGGHDEELIIAEVSTGDLYTLELEAPETHDAPRVFRVGPDAGERWLAGSSFQRWLAAVIAHDALLYDAEGEFLPDAFEPDGEELTPTFALRQAERALRKDPGSAIYHYEKGVALRRMGRLDSAREAFGAAAAIDPTNPWPWFDLGRADQMLGRYPEAAAAFECAAEAADGAEGARFCAWAARAFHLAGDRATAERLRAAAVARDPKLIESLRAAAAAAREGDGADDEDAGESARDAEDLAALLGGVPLARRLPVLRPPAVPPAPPRPRPAAGTKAGTKGGDVAVSKNGGKTPGKSAGPRAPARGATPKNGKRKLSSGHSKPPAARPSKPKPKRHGR